MSYILQVNKKIKRYGIVCLLLLSSFVLKAQMIDTVIAKLTYVQKPTKNKTQVLVSVSFINNTDVDIYLPALFSESSWPLGGNVTTYRKIGNKYESDGSIGSSIPIKSLKPSIGPSGELVLANPISGYSKDDIIISYGKKYREKKLQERNEILKQFGEQNPNVELEVLSKKDLLFLKAHEEFEIYLIGNLGKLVTIPNDYKVNYRLDYELKDKEQYPDKILSYQRYIPKAMPCNDLYIKLEK